MGKSFTIARMFGIEIRADFSWLVIAALIFWSLGSHYFPTNYPELSLLDSWSLALGTTAFLYVSVAAHELGHSVVSSRSGIPVKTVQLFFFGGIAQISRQPQRARDEFLIAIAGPLVSLVLALGFGTLVWVGPEIVGLKLSTFGEWVSRANVWLLAFNLIPGLPLDGGRILRAVIWGVSGNFNRATRISGLTGKMTALGLIGWGSLQVLGGGFGNGLWISFIGWYLYEAVTHTLKDLSIREFLSGYSVRDVMDDDCPLVPPIMTLDRLVNEVVLPTGKQCFRVSGGGSRISGVITMEDVRAVNREGWPNTTIGMAMKPIGELREISSDIEAYAALLTMAKVNDDEFAVLDNGKLLGVITRDQILMFLRNISPRY